MKSNHWSKIGVSMLALVGATSGAVGCSAGTGSESNADSVTSEGSGETVTRSAKPLLTLDTGSTRIDVFEDRPGEVLVAEEGPEGVESALKGWDGKTSTLMELYKTVAPKLKAGLSAEAMNTLAAADVRLASQRKTLQLQEPHQSLLAPEVISPEETGPSSPNYYSYEGDLSWFTGNFCKPNTWCSVWYYWTHSGRRTNIRNWRCTVFNHSDSGTANLTLWQKTCSGIFCGTVWEKTHVDPVAARTWRAYWTTVGTEQGVECMADGVNGTVVAGALYWDTSAPPAPQPPPPSCGPYIYRAQTVDCLNVNGTPSSLKSCADGCGATPEQAQANAATALSRGFPLGCGAGCCNVAFDQNFNWCGY